MNIFVGSLPFKIEESELQEIFEEYGEVTSVKIITDRATGRSKGFGFVEMTNEEEAKKAIEEVAKQAELEKLKTENPVGKSALVSAGTTKANIIIPTANPKTIQLAVKIPLII